MKRIAYYGGSFDPVHRGHLAVARSVLERFDIDEFYFLPAFHAPHKFRNRPTSAFDRYAMLCLVSNNDKGIKVSRMEIEAPDRPYTVETLTTLRTDLTDTEIFFVMGADSWMDINTWRRWEEVLTLSNHIVITRPGVDIRFDHVTEAIRERIVDLRDARETAVVNSSLDTRIYITDAVNIDISATDIRSKIRANDASWQDDVADEVAKYVEKYQIYN